MKKVIRCVDYTDKKQYNKFIRDTENICYVDARTGAQGKLSVVLKNVNSNLSPYNYFDILGDDENALSKAFSYLLSIDKDCFFSFMHLLGIKLKNTSANFAKYKIEIQRKRESGITDIEITDEKKNHVIVECKIKNGKVQKQRTQYNNEFINNCDKYLCLLTEIYDSNIQTEGDVKVISISWYDIITMLNTKDFLSKEFVVNFIKFAERNYKMNNIKEILIQGLSNDEEEKRYNEYCIYRRNLTFGSPLYFAPYFSKMKDKNNYGIKSLSKILGIITATESGICNYISEFEKFTEDKSLIEKWKKGIKIVNSKNDQTLYTYYFLRKELEFKNPLVKDGGIQKGRGKNWIAANIPQNRCVSFSDFLKHIPELM